MSDREALAAALDQGSLILGRLDGPGLRKAYVETETAARKTLAQLPEKCPTTHWITGECPDCHGSGKVYPAELVERIAKIFFEVGYPHEKAVAVLDALNETP